MADLSSHTMTDLQIKWWRTALGDPELQHVTAAITQEHLAMGPVTAHFEKELANLLGVPFVIATTSASVALFMALLSLGIGPDDEVIVPNRTFIATAHAALMVGAKVVLIDVREDIPNLDCDQLLAKMSPRTKAIIAVHRNGRSVEMNRLVKIASANNISVIEDAAQALFSRNSSGYLGTFGDIGCFSFGVTKLITTGFGGMIATKDEKIAVRLRRIRNHGISRDNDHYDMLGCNFKFSDILASLGVSQLVQLSERLEHLRRIYRLYLEGLDELDWIRPIPVDVASGEIPLWTEVVVDERAPFLSYLHEQGIETRPFHPNLNVSPHIGDSNPSQFPRSDRFAAQGLILPCGPTQPLSHVETVIQIIRQYEKKRNSKH
ncbi:aminotransferase class V-fold PLP-dependent enzyme [candidate division KSB3 bacterium]|uniref:Aminotransferase class V-fold PLP-dependent enzyme n=1 Tax=candidate division KSB3 bacterium TaxID=2044937 RepID=A0A9D5JXJ5_9BACT|nr:aminotransferase class V-fold PLP-dependent enzyme [candidate division KSB3 bacterium]MBD3326078.1 aminotransferase class V-fold PLP-dependent enzyme [candidate division KSB3 bacterium]